MKRRSAFTLVEVLVALAVMGALGLVLHQFLRFTTASSRRSTSRGTLLDGATKVFLHLSHDLQRSPAVECPSPGDVTQELVYQDAQRVSWKLSLEKGILVRSSRMGVKRETVSENVEDLVFRRESRSLLSVELLLHHGKEHSLFRSAFYLRAASRPQVEVDGGGGSNSSSPKGAMSADLEKLQSLLGLLRQVIPR